MPRVIVGDLELKTAGGGYRHQRAKFRQTDLNGRTCLRDCWIPVEPGREPYPPGVYRLSERSYYVERPKEQLKLIPRLVLVRALDCADDLSSCSAADPVGLL